MENINLRKSDIDYKLSDINITQETYENQECNQEESSALEDEIKSRLTKLPTSRIRVIMKTDTEVNMVNQEAVFLITKATEFFIGALAKESYNYTHQSKKKTLQKDDVQSAIVNVDALTFLDGILQ